MLNLVKSIPKRYFSVSLSAKEWGLPDDYEILSSLGKGSSARVFLGANIVTGQRVVIKMFKQLPVESIRQQIGINMDLLAGLKDQQNKQSKYKEFIHLVDTCYDYGSSTFTLIYQFFHGVTLNQLITVMPINQALKHIFILAHTLKYIHKLGIIHRDIKPANVLITKDGPKLFDFGLAKRKDEKILKTNNFGTKCYKCPQVVYRMDSYNQSVDVWGLGFILAEIAVKKRHLLPYSTDREMLSQVANLCQMKEQDRSLFRQQLSPFIRIQKSRAWHLMAKRKEVDSGVIQLVRAMLQINPANRPTIDEVIAHHVFREYQNENTT